MRKIIKKKKDISSFNKNLIGLGISAIFGTIISVILTLLFSYIFANSKTLSDSISVIFVACILVGGLICGIISARLTELKGIISGIISSVIYFLLITIIMLFFADGRLSATTFLLCLGTYVTSIIGGIGGANIKRRK